jgi:hypothetical protein
MQNENQDSSNLFFKELELRVLHKIKTKEPANTGSNFKQFEFKLLRIYFMLP